MTDRTVHELLRRLGREANLPDVLTCRHTRRTWLRHALATLPMPIVAELAGHRLGRGERPDLDAVVAAQFSAGWVSVLDAALLEMPALRRAA